MRRALLAGAIATSACDALTTTSCFVRGTRVSTPSGPRPIEALAVGDEVLAFRSSDGAVVVRKVEAVLRGVARRVRIVSVEGTEIVTTEEHPFWSAEERRWVRAADVDETTVLVRLADSSALASGATMPARVAHVRWEERADEPVYNLTVEGPEHTYFAEGIAVHNKSYASPPITIVNETDADVELITRAPRNNLHIHSQVLDGTLAAPVPASVFSVVPESNGTIARGATREEWSTGTVEPFSSRSTFSPQSALVVTVPGSGASWLLVGVGSALIRREGSAFDIVPRHPELLRIVRLDRPHTACTATEMEGRLRFPDPLPDFDPPRALRLEEQSYDGSCFLLQLVPTEPPVQAITSQVCLPESTWPFVAGDDLLFRDDSSVERRRVMVERLPSGPNVVLSRTTRGALPATIGTKAVHVEPRGTCASVDPACGSVVVPAVIVDSREGGELPPAPFATSFPGESTSIRGVSTPVVTVDRCGPSTSDHVIETVTTYRP